MSNMTSLKDRDQAIDVLKGLLVLLMVVYHALNYLDTGSIPHRYLGFLPASFIMITGVLVIWAYQSKWGLTPATTALRLSFRGTKLLLLFTFLNIAAHLVFTRNRYGTEMSVHGFFAQWEQAYVLGSASGVAFDVLPPIAYTLLSSILLLWLASYRTWYVSVLAVGLFGYCVMLDLSGHGVATLHLMTAGCIGIALGCIGPDTINRAVHSPALLAAALAAYLVPLLAGLDSYATQASATIASLALLYALARRLPHDYWPIQQINLLGRYSLLSYIVQILYLQASRAIPTPAAGWLVWTAVVLVALAGLLTWLTVLGVDAARKRLALMDRAYRIVFA